MSESEPATVLHFRGGTTEHLPMEPEINSGDEIVSITSFDGSPRSVKFSELKAVFFLRNPDREPTPVPESIVTSMVLLVEFADGENIRGLAPSYGPAQSGFFLFPVDRSKNDRIFVIGSAISSIDIEKL